MISEGHAAISTRRVAEEAGLNHGLVHYYFGSMEELFVQVLERFTARLIERQRALYANDAPFIEKWRAAMNFLQADHASGYQKICFDLQALAWNRPELRGRIGRVNAEWRSVLEPKLAVDRTPRWHDRVKYDHLFVPGEPENKRFWTDFKMSPGELINSYVTLEVCT